MILKSIALAALLGAGPADTELTDTLRRPHAVSATTPLFGLHWHRPIVRTGRHRTVGESFGKPGIATGAGVVIVGNGEGDVYALRLKDGGAVWRYSYGVPFESAVTIAPFGDDESEQAIIVARDGALLSFNVKTGDILWQAKLNAESRAPATLAGSRLLIATAKNTVYAIDKDSGIIGWQTGRAPSLELSVVGHSAVAVAGNLAIATFSDGYVEAYRLLDGAAQWSQQLSLKGGEFIDADADPVVAGDKVFVASYSDGIYALAKKDGKVLWNRPAPSVTSLVAHRDLLIAGSADGYVWGLSQANGEMLYRTRLRPGALSRMEVRKGLIVFGNGDAGIIVLNAANGRPLQAEAFGDRIAGDPAWDSENKHLAVLGSRGEVYALRFGGPPLGH